MSTVKLRCFNGEIVEVDFEIAKSLNLVINQRAEECIELPKIKGLILKIVIEWLVCNKNNTKAINEINAENTFDNSLWNEKLHQMNLFTLFNFVNAADELDIQNLTLQVMEMLTKMSEEKSDEELGEMINEELVPEFKVLQTPQE